jgi:hypothetical protein
MTASVSWELVRGGHLLRSLRLAPFAPGLTAIVVLLVARRNETDDVIGDLRLLGLLLALGSGYVLDDAAAATLQASPYGLARRVGLRLGAAVAIVAPLWTLMLVRLLPSAPANEQATLGVGVTLELAAALAVVWAVAAWARRGGSEHPGVITTPVILALLLMAASISQVPMLVDYGPQWTAAHARWSTIVVVAVSGLLAGMRDPAARWRTTNHHPNQAK